jgi:hypothetical protein
MKQSRCRCGHVLSRHDFSYTSEGACIVRNCGCSKFIQTPLPKCPTSQAESIYVECLVRIAALLGDTDEAIGMCAIQRLQAYATCAVSTRPINKRMARVNGEVQTGQLRNTTFRKSKDAQDDRHRQSNIYNRKSNSPNCKFRRPTRIGMCQCIVQRLIEPR